MVDDALRQALGDRCLAHAGFADQYRVVLGAALQYLDATADFLVAANDRVKPRLFRQLGQVYGVFLQCLPVVLGIGVDHLLAATHILDRLFNRFTVRAGCRQDVRKHAL